MKQTVLIVDDNQDITRFLERLIKSELDIETRTADNGQSAISIIEENTVDCVITDMKMPGIDGLKLLQDIKNKDSLLPVIMMTAFGTIDTAVNAIKEGAYDYLTKPFEEKRLLHTVRGVLDRRNPMHKNSDSQGNISKNEEGIFFVGETPRIRELMATLKLVAKTNVPVLLTGETGTGKELAAQLIHKLSNRASKPFVVVNCPAIPETILESELFGYRKGAFSGADTDKEGLFQAADGGTLFLDEIGDISPSLQAKLLRVLQEGELRPLGDSSTYSIDVRVVGATNRNLEDSISTGFFRSDLYYRLNVISVSTPPLREITEDIPLIAQYFLSSFCSELGLDPKKLTKDAIQFLMSREWKGNARELRNQIKRAVIFSRTEFLSAEDFGNGDSPVYDGDGLTPGWSIPDAKKDPETYMLDYKGARKKILAVFNEEYITDVLRQTGGNVSMAAQISGIERQYLQHLMRKNGITSGEFRKN